MNIINNFQKNTSFNIDKFKTIETLRNGINSVTKLVSTIINQMPLEKAVILAYEIPRQFTQLTNHFLDCYYFPDSEVIDIAMKADGTAAVREIIYTHQNGRSHALISKGADLNFLDTQGSTPLHRAMASNPEIVEILIANGADVKIPDI